MQLLLCEEWPTKCKHTIFSLLTNNYSGQSKQCFSWETMVQIFQYQNDMIYRKKIRVKCVERKLFKKQWSCLRTEENIPRFNILNFHPNKEVSKITHNVIMIKISWKLGQIMPWPETNDGFPPLKNRIWEKHETLPLCFSE